MRQPQPPVSPDLSAAAFHLTAANQIRGAGTAAGRGWRRAPHRAPHCQVRHACRGTEPAVTPCGRRYAAADCADGRGTRCPRWCRGCPAVPAPAEGGAGRGAGRSALPWHVRAVRLRRAAVRHCHGAFGGSAPWRRSVGTFLATRQCRGGPAPRRCRVAVRRVRRRCPAVRQSNSYRWRAAPLVRRRRRSRCSGQVRVHPAIVQVAGGAGRLTGPGWQAPEDRGTRGSDRARCQSPARSRFRVATGFPEGCQPCRARAVAAAVRARRRRPSRVRKV
jgi:hypothetical protein